MKIEKIWSISAVVLVLCALVSTALVVEQRFASDREPPPRVAEPIFVENWKDALPFGLRIGPENAPVQVIEFGDFECPYCAKFESTVSWLRRNYTESVAVIFVHYPLAQHSAAREAAAAAQCEQGRFREMKEVLFSQFHDLNSVDWGELASEAQVPEIEEFHICVSSPATMSQVDESKDLADRMGVSGTPEIMVNGWMLPFTPTREDFGKMVENVNQGLTPIAGIFE